MLKINVTKCKVLDSERSKQAHDQKDCYFDVHLRITVEDKNKMSHHMVVEMQNAKDTNFSRRLAYYASTTVVQEYNPALEYDKGATSPREAYGRGSYGSQSLLPVITIAICNHRLFQEEPLSKATIIEASTCITRADGVPIQGFVNFHDLYSFFIIQLPTVDPDRSKVDQEWLWMIAHLDKAEGEITSSDETLNR